MKNSREITIKTTYEIEIDEQLFVINYDEAKELYDLLGKIINPEKKQFLEMPPWPEIYRTPGWEFPNIFGPSTCDGTTIIGGSLNTAPTREEDDF